MNYIGKKISAVFSHSTSRLLMTAALCAICALTVLHTAANAIMEEKPLPESRIILAFAADSNSDFAGKLAGEAEGFPITVTVNEQNTVIMVTGGTVRDALKLADVQTGPNDLVKPSLDAEVKEFDRIVVQQCELQTYTKEYEIPYETYYHYSPEVSPYQEVIQQKGEAGRKVETYSQLVYRGEMVEETLVSRDVKKEPMDEKILIGFKSKPVSSFDFEWSFDENNEPANYSYVIRDTKAAGYSAPSTAGTASGRRAMVGHVAVDPNDIPYGSKLFIQSSDGSFIYGYAIAADTGTALMQDIIDVDLFYATYAQSAANGIKTVDIFVLE